jgi:hypothetical protein
MFWLLAYQGRISQKSTVGERLRLVFVQPAGRTAVDPTPSPAPARPIAGPHVPFAPRPIDEAVSQAPSSTAQPASHAPAATLMDQARQVATDQAPLSFASDPLRNRRAQLPGGDRRGSFRMKEPVSAARIVERIGEAFGNRPVCPDIQGRIAGLLNATSDRERELLDEELRRDREYCRP